MEGLSWKFLAVVVIFGLCNVIVAAPAGDAVTAEAGYDLSPVSSSEASISLLCKLIWFPIQFYAISLLELVFFFGFCVPLKLCKRLM